MDPYRFYVTSAPAPGTALDLPEDQAHHALHVLRLAAGTPVEVFNGQGAWGRGTLASLGKRGATIAVSEAGADPRPSTALTLATAAPKADRAEWLVEQASQLNAARIQWLDCDRGVVKPREGGGKLDKFRRLAIESAKQCGRNWLLEIDPMRPLEQVLAEARARGQVLWWLEPRQGQSILSAAAQDAAAPAICALIGPEGGWSDREIQLLAAAPDIRRIRLTPTILRIETACAAVATILGCQRP